MTETEFSALLDRLITDGQISASQRAELLAIYRRDGAPAALAPDALIPRDDSIFDEAAILALLLLLIGSQPVESLTETQRISATDRAHDIYQERAAKVATDDLSAWAAGIAAELATLYGATYYIGAGDLAMATSAALPVVQTETAYISGFSDELALKRTIGNEPSAAAILARLALYGGMARAGMFLLAESNEGDSAGWVYNYTAVDDSGTCSPCANAQGVYLAGQGPMPGDVCLGRGRCRCRRERVYRPDVYRQLTGAQ